MGQAGIYCAREIKRIESLELIIFTFISVWQTGHSKETAAIYPFALL